MTESNWTLAELQAALDKATGHIDKINAIIDSYGSYPQTGVFPECREAKRRLPELRKVEALLMERIKEALARKGGSEC